MPQKDVYKRQAGILSGMLGAMGLGGGGVLIIYLTLFANLQQQTAQGINLLLFLPCAAISVILYHRKGPVSYTHLSHSICGVWYKRYG